MGAQISLKVPKTLTVPSRPPTFSFVTYKSSETMMFSRSLMNTMIARTNATVIIVFSIVMPVTFVHSAAEVHVPSLTLDDLAQCMEKLPNGGMIITLPPNMNTYDQFNEAMITKLAEAKLAEPEGRSQKFPKAVAQIIASYTFGKQSDKDMLAALQTLASSRSQPMVQLSIRVGRTYYLKLPLRPLFTMGSRSRPGNIQTHRPQR